MHLKLRDIFVLTFAVGVLFVLLVLFVTHAREEARRMQCANFLKQLGLAIHNYHDVNKSLPCAMGGTDGGPLVSNASSITGFVGMIPYMDCSAIYNRIVSGRPPGGTAPWIQRTTMFDVWETRFPYLVCLSDSSAGSTASTGQYGPTNYAFCWGDSVASILDVPDALPTRGPFQARVYKRFADVSDGLSNTVAMGEIARKSASPKHGVVAVVHGIDQNPSFCLAQFDGSRFVKGATFVSSAQRRGGRWCDGRPFYTGFTTVLPPNSLSCSPTDDDGTWGIYSASSNHTGVVQVAMLDGSIRTISNSIDCGTITSAAPDAAQRAGERLASPYGIWGAMGTIASGEEIPAVE